MRMLYLIGVMGLAFAGGLLTLSARQWLVDTKAGESSAAELSVIDRFRLDGVARNRGEGEITSPLVTQAAAFALYLNPPRPAAPLQDLRPRVTPPPAPRPVVVAPKFRLLLTSCHHSDPEKSLALISEPGRGDHWIRKGDVVGHLVVEEIKDGVLVYRDGNQLQEATVVLKQGVQLARVASTSSDSSQPTRADVRLATALNARQSGMRSPSVNPGNYEQE